MTALCLHWSSMLMATLNSPDQWQTICRRLSKAAGRELHAALNDNNSQRLKHTAHTMKGPVCYFANASATNAAQQLEQHGLNDYLTTARSRLATWKLR